MACCVSSCRKAVTCRSPARRCSMTLPACSTADRGKRWGGKPRKRSWPKRWRNSHPVLRLQVETKVPVELALAGLGDVLDPPAIDQYPAVLEVIEVRPLGMQDRPEIRRRQLVHCSLRSSIGG